MLGAGCHSGAGCCQLVFCGWSQPRLRRLRVLQHGQAHAGIGAALVVVGGGGEQPHGVVAPAVDAGLVKGGGRERRRAGLGPHLVARQKRGLAVEDRVFHGLGGSSKAEERATT